MRKLNEMTLEELWQLFPIILTEYNPYWVDWYKEEIAQLKKILPFDVIYHHIGSTAIKGLIAKPIIDILIVVSSDSQLQQTAKLLEKQGYIIMSSTKGRISLNKGYTENGFAEKVFHLHIRIKGDDEEVYFRDYLNEHKKIAKEYEQLKLQLAKLYKNNRDAYTEAKSEFINKITTIAKQKG